MQQKWDNWSEKMVLLVGWLVGWLVGFSTHQPLLGYLILKSVYFPKKKLYGFKNLFQFNDNPFFDNLFFDDPFFVCSFTVSRISF